MIQFTATLVIQFLFIVLVVYAIISDVTKLVIPNWLSLSLLLLFCVYCILNSPNISLSKSLAVAGMVFAVAAILFNFGVLGGGDVKIVTVLSLWVGPENIINFIILVNIIGAALGITVIKSSYFSRYYPALLEKNKALAKIDDWRSKRICPYGIAIGSAALIVAPALFA